jgi:hypothetical protein
MEEQEQDFTITIEGKQYKYADLEPENKGLVRHIRDLEAQLDQVNFKFEQVNASKLFFSEKLIQNLKQATPDASVDDQPLASKE